MNFENNHVLVIYWQLYNFPSSPKGSGYKWPWPSGSDLPDPWQKANRGPTNPSPPNPHWWWLGLFFFADTPGVSLTEERNPNIMEPLSDYILYSYLVHPVRKTGTLQSCPSGTPITSWHLATQVEHQPASLELKDLGQLYYPLCLG